MKTLFASIILFVSISLFAQSSRLEIGVSTGAEFYKHDYTYQGGGIANSIEEVKSYGFHAGLRVGYQLGGQFALRTGLSYAEKQMHPRLTLGFAYGPLAVDFAETQLWDPYLYKHQFKTLEIPFLLVFKPALKSKFKPVFSGGFNGSFQFFESEIYKANSGVFFQPAQSEPNAQIAIDDESFRTFGVSFDAGIGLSYEILKTLSIELTHRFSLIEFRPGNEKWKGNNQMLYEDSWMYLSKMGAELTILKTF